LLNAKLGQTSTKPASDDAIKAHKELIEEKYRIASVPEPEPAPWRYIFNSLAANELERQWGTGIRSTEQVKEVQNKQQPKQPTEDKRPADK
jgi:hypothetical protein